MDTKDDPTNIEYTSEDRIRVDADNIKGNYYGSKQWA